MIYLYFSLVFACVWFGVCQAKKLSSRYQFYSEFIQFLKAYEENLSFRQDNLKDLVARYCKCEESDFKSYLNSVIITTENKIPEYLNKKEVEHARDVLLSLGKTDQLTEKQLVKHYLVVIDEKRKHTYEIKEKYSSLSIKISLLIGLLLVVLLL